MPFTVPIRGVQERGSKGNTALVQEKRACVRPNGLLGAAKCGGPYPYRYSRRLNNSLSFLDVFFSRRQSRLHIVIFYSPISIPNVLSSSVLINKGRLLIGRADLSSQSLVILYRSSLLSKSFTIPLKLS